MTRCWLARLACCAVVASVLVSCTERVRVAELDDCNEGPGLFYPLRVGAWWRHVVELEPTGVEPDKVVFIDEQGAPPFRDHVPDAFRARSLERDFFALRWQSVEPDGSVLRHVDERFDPETCMFTRVDHYCPSRIRIGDRTCTGMLDRDTFASLRLEAHSYEKWALCMADADDAANCDALEAATVQEGLDCRALEIDSETCQYAGDAGGCTVTPRDEWTDWEVVDAHEHVTDDYAASGEGLIFSGTLHVKSVESDDDIEEFWWARGIGKIKNKENDQTEWLSAWCVEGDCAATNPAQGLYPASTCFE